MKCPLCSTWSTVSETRGTRRRRECANGHRFTTTEVVEVEARDRATAQRLGVARQRLREMGFLRV